MLNKLRVFVYGTLKPGEFNYNCYCAGKVLEAQKAIALGKLFSLPVGYPAMTSGNEPVRGCLLTFENDEILTALDSLENYDPQRPSAENHYNRQKIETFDATSQSLGLAWAYLMTFEQVQQLGGTWLPEGDWRSCTQLQ